MRSGAGVPGVTPAGWTGSGRCFDHLVGVPLLELRQAAIADRGMQASLVVDLIDEAREVRRDVIEGFLDRLTEPRAFGGQALL